MDFGARREHPLSPLTERRLENNWRHGQKRMEGGKKRSYKSCTLYTVAKKRKGRRAEAISNFRIEILVSQESKKKDMDRPPTETSSSPFFFESTLVIVISRIELRKKWT